MTGMTKVTKFTRRRLLGCASATSLFPIVFTNKGQAQVMKTPGVYIVEKDAFPNSVVQVATAVPAFIGYTQIAVKEGRSLHMTPWRISSLAEFHQYFGAAPTPVFDLELMATSTTEGNGDELQLPEIKVSLSDGTESQTYTLRQVNTAFALYAAIRLFFQNGGGSCYIVSTGSYANVVVDGDHEAGEALITAQPMLDALKVLEKEPEPTLIVIPETTRLSRTDSQKVQQATLTHCGDKMKNRFAILDIRGGYLPQDPVGFDPVQTFRDDIGTQHLSYGATYYPWLNTSLFSSVNFNYLNLSATARSILAQKVKAAEEALIPPVERLPKSSETEAQAKARLDIAYPQRAEIAKIDEVDLSELDHAAINKNLRANVPAYGEVMSKVAESANCMPPGSAIAGIYTQVDNNRGVWKAPANVSVNSVVSTMVNVGHEEQEGLNISPMGKSVNAIRPFAGEGVLVWGARTLDGNSLDWRYINVRRTIIMIEESIRLAAEAYVFEPNTASTWVTVKSMIENFLTGIWKQGGLAGAVPADAFSVHVGLGETMTPQDILDGVMRITVLVAVVRPAEFIEITFQQQMQKS